MQIFSIGYESRVTLIEFILEYDLDQRCSSEGSLCFSIQAMTSRLQPNYRASQAKKKSLLKFNVKFKAFSHNVIQKKFPIRRELIIKGFNLTYSTG